MKRLWRQASRGRSILRGWEGRCRVGRISFLDVSQLLICLLTFAIPGVRQDGVPGFVIPRILFDEMSCEGIKEAHGGKIIQLKMTVSFQ